MSPKPTFLSNLTASSRAWATGLPCTATGPSMTFSNAVLCGKRLYCWNTMPDLRRSAKISCLLGFLEKSMLNGCALSNSIRPCSGISKAFKQRKKVVLPEPEGPRITTTCPLPTSKSMPRKMVFSPKVLWILRILIMTTPYLAT